MKIDQFKKAAKRYSADAQLPLSTAQENLATYFGFKNFDAAVKALAKDPPSKDEIKDSAVAISGTKNSDYFWCDLTFVEFKLLCLLLENQSPRETDPLSWRFRALNAFAAYLAAVNEIGYKPKNTRNLVQSFSLRSLCEKYKTIAEKYPPTRTRDVELKDFGVIHENWPTNALKLADYLESIPGMSTLRLRESYRMDGQLAPPQRKTPYEENTAAEQHQYMITICKDAFFRFFTAIEAQGGAAAMRWFYTPNAARDGEKLPEFSSLKEKLEFFVNEKIAHFEIDTLAQFRHGLQGTLTADAVWAA